MATLFQQDPRFTSLLSAFFLLPALSAFLFPASVALVVSPFLPGGISMRITGIAPVTQDGVPISRLRSVGRTLVAWSPALVVPQMVFLSVIGGEQLLRSSAIVWLSVTIAIRMAVGAIYAIVNPERGIQDRIAGTYLVPR